MNDAVVIYYHYQQRGDAMKKIAVINDLSGFGKCSLTAAIPVISAFGIQCCPLTTAVLSNQTGYESYACRDLTDDMPAFIEEWKKLNASFNGILTGFISSGRQGRIIADLIDSFNGQNTLVVVDPVMADDGKIYDFYDEQCVQAIKRLADKADIITPNLTELCILAGEDYEKIISLEYNALIRKIKDMCLALNEKAQRRIVTSGIKAGGKIANAVFENGSIDIIEAEAFRGSFSGTGDILSAFITACCVNGTELREAVKQAADFIQKSIYETVKDTGGNYNCCDGVNFEKFLYTLGGLKDEKG